MTRTGPDVQEKSQEAREILGKIARASFAVLSHVTKDGAPRSSGVVYAVTRGHLFVAVAPDSWKARQVTADPRVAVTVPVRRGGLLALLAPIPPATISFAGRATVHPSDVLDEVPGLTALVPPTRRAECVILEIQPVGHYVTYGIGVPLLAMRDPSRARARVPVG